MGISLGHVWLGYGLVQKRGGTLSRQFEQSWLNRLDVSRASKCWLSPGGGIFRYTQIGELKLMPLISNFRRILVQRKSYKGLHKKPLVRYPIFWLHHIPVFLGCWFSPAFFKGEIHMVENPPRDRAGHHRGTALESDGEATMPSTGDSGRQCLSGS